MKYYTPKIEEFHVGFECEINMSHKPEYWEEAIVKVIDEEYSEGDVTILAATSKSYQANVFGGGFVGVNQYFRVKYLDIEDIESLGWIKKLNKYVIDKSTEFPNETIRFILNFNGSTNIEIFKTSLTSYGNHNEKMQFKINNKSELRKLMQQLNVL